MPFDIYFLKMFSLFYLSTGNFNSTLSLLSFKDSFVEKVNGVCKYLNDWGNYIRIALN